MNRTLIILICLLTIPALAGKWTVLWDKSPEPDVTSYQVYELINGTNSLLATTVTNGAILLNVANGTHTYFVTAMNSAGIISDPSTNLVVGYPTPPGNIKVK